jgi:hypothetical protein
MATTKVKVLIRHPSHDGVPGEVIDLDEVTAKSLINERVADGSEDAIANPTLARDESGNLVDLELQKQIAREKAKPAKNPNDEEKGELVD